MVRAHLLSWRHQHPCDRAALSSGFPLLPWLAWGWGVLQEFWLAPSASCPGATREQFFIFSAWASGVSIFFPAFQRQFVSVHKSSSSSFQLLHDLSKVSLSLGTKARKTWRPLPPSPYSLLWDKAPQRRQGQGEQGEGKVNTWKWYSCHKSDSEHDLISSYTHLTDKENWGSEMRRCLLKAIQLIHRGSTIYNQVCLSSNCPPPRWAT